MPYSKEKTTFDKMDLIPSYCERVGGGGAPAELEAKERARVRRSSKNANFDRRQT
jgi:hypothetical protein